jgi:dihydroorotate dehydrogenase electron transfer subunit
MYIVLKNVIQDTNIPTYVSLEERMGCGIGACLVCTCGIKKDGKVENKRVCKDGPVFDILKVVL